MRGCLRNSTSMGFTLTELIVVITIISILGYVTVMSLGRLGDSRIVKSEAENLFNILKMVNEESTLQKKEMGTRIVGNKIDIMEYSSESGKWKESLIDGKSSEHNIPENIKISVEVEGIPVSTKYKKEKPTILFLSSGDVTPFRIILESEGNKHQIEWLATSRIGLDVVEGNK